MIRPERICIAALNAPKRVDFDQCQSVTWVVHNMIYAGPLRKYHVRIGSSLLVVREHVVSGRRALRPGDEAPVEWLRSDI
ncbi:MULTISPECIES: TOBE domain-containing protein [unclassified Bradyrhizobium]|uniref:TOBE domain-containing protein n=1 Tax=unclassified Bradyrhizobium TaxID=2631580 RepID=UPI001CD1D984|nr:MULTISPECIES: TOBE domain-containing protein [unclassified Bradyrhizobium]